GLVGSERSKVLDLEEVEERPIAVRYVPGELLCGGQGGGNRVLLKERPPPLLPLILQPPQYLVKVLDHHQNRSPVQLLQQVVGQHSGPAFVRRGSEFLARGRGKLVAVLGVQGTEDAQQKLPERRGSFVLGQPGNTYPLAHGRILPQTADEQGDEMALAA